MNDKIRVFVSSGCGKGKEKYNKIRKQLKDRIESTGLADVYLWEDDARASTLPAQQIYLREIDECHVCIFLIDNKDGIFEGVVPEIQRAKTTNTKSIYIFCTENSNNPTWVEKELNGAYGSKYYKISIFSDFADIAYESIIKDIVDIYQRYCRSWLIDTEFTYKENKLTEINKLDYVPFTKSLFSNLDKTKIHLSKNIFDNHRTEKESSVFDECCMSFLKVVLGEKQFSEFNPLLLLSEIKNLQSESTYNITSIRWDAITSYYANDTKKCIEHLSKAIEVAQETKAPEWLISDILIDLRNIENLKSEMEGSYTLENDFQKLLNEQTTPLYYPILDRLNNNFYEELENPEIKKNYNLLIQQTLVIILTYFQTIFLIFLP